MTEWGPRGGGPQVPVRMHRRRRNGCLTVVMVLLVIAGLQTLNSASNMDEVGVPQATSPTTVFGIILLLGPALYWGIPATAPARQRRREQLAKRRRQAQTEAWARTRPAALIAADADPLSSVRSATWQHGRGGCVYLGVDVKTRDWLAATQQQAVLVLGPPRSGKTSGIIIPSILAAIGPVVSTSTKLEVMSATAAARSRFGRIWSFDPSGTEVVPDGALTLHWSPIWSSRRWDGARSMAAAMLDGSSVSGGVENASYWTESAKMLLAPLLHAAALAGLTILDVRRWVTSMNMRQAGQILERSDAELAADDLDAIGRMEARGLSAVYSTARQVLGAYGSDAAAARSRDQNFDADKFVRSGDTIYITAPSQLQNMLAPLVAGLLDEIRDATYRYARGSNYAHPNRPAVLWALDEVANIAPLKNLPDIVSEAGGQGLQVMACLQDLSQARTRWGSAADGFLSLFGTKVIFPGIGDKQTLDSLSTMVGDWDRPYESYNINTGSTDTNDSEGEAWTFSTQREAKLSPSEVSNIPRERALVVRLGHWSLAEVTPYNKTQPWMSVIASAPAAIDSRGDVDHFRLS